MVELCPEPCALAPSHQTLESVGQAWVPEQRPCAQSSGRGSDSGLQETTPHLICCAPFV